MGREVGGGLRMGNMCAPVADACWCMSKPIQYCKVKKNKYIKIKCKKKRNKESYDGDYCLPYLLVVGPNPNWLCPLSFPKPALNVKFFVSLAHWEHKEKETVDWNLSFKVLKGSWFCFGFLFLTLVKSITEKETLSSLKIFSWKLAILKQMNRLF